MDEEHDNDESLIDATNEALEAVALLFREPTAQEQAMLGRRRTLDTRKAEKNAPSRRLQSFARK